MKKYFCAFLILILSNHSFADEKSELIQTDLKFLCHISKIEKKLLADKSLSIADVVERSSAMRTASVRAQETKDFLAGIVMAEKSEQAKLWKQFARDNKVKFDCI